MTGNQPDEPSSIEAVRERLNTSTAHPARVYDVLLGGKDNFEADRKAAEAVLQASPKTAQAARANRAFLERAVTYLTGEAGIRQFLDIGTGLPTANNTHEVAQRIAPETRVVYVDNDPIVLLHARALLTSTEQGRTSYIDADLRDPGKILSEAADLLDFSRPVAVMLIAILHFIKDEEDPFRIVRTLLDPLPSGSHLVVNHVASDINPDVAKIARSYNSRVPTGGIPRDHAQCARFFDGLELVEPGVVPYTKWRPRSELEAAAYTIGWSGVGRKP